MSSVSDGPWEVRVEWLDEMLPPCSVEMETAEGVRLMVEASLPEAALIRIEQVAA